LVRDDHSNPTNKVRPDTEVTGPARPYRAAMYGSRQRPSHLICGLCPSITDTSIALRFPHMLIIHAVLDHDVSLWDVARSRRVEAPSGSVSWRLPDRRAWALLWKVTDYRI